jgi:hypothetical protein
MNISVITELIPIAINSNGLVLLNPLNRQNLFFAQNPPIR